MRHRLNQLWAAMLLLGIAASVAAGQQTPVAAADAALARERLVSRQQELRSVQDYPVLPAEPLARVLHFRIEQNNLALYTDVPPTPSMSQIAVNDLPGLCTLDIHAFNQFKPPAHLSYTPMVMLFIRRDFDAPGCSESATTVQINPMSLQVSLDQTTLSEERQVSLVQSAPAVSNDELPVRLTVNIQSSDVPPVRFTRSAADFLSLRRQYPADTARYLEPIFRSLHADAVVFDADPRVAWQVFAAQATPDPAVTTSVRQILARMDADDFRTREAAAEELKRLGQPAAVALQHMDRAALTPEQSSRAEAFLSSYHPVSDEQAGRLRSDVNFLLDCLLDERDPFVVNAALARLGDITGKDVKLDAHLRGADRQEAVFALRQTLTSPAAGSAATAPSH
jgi:hypothetical protein